MKQKGFAPMLIVLAISILGIVGYFVNKYFKLPNQLPPSPTPITTAANEITFTDTLTKIDVGCDILGNCIADAPIKAKIGKYWVTIDLGGDPSPEMEKERGPKGSIFLPDGSKTGGLPKDFSIGARIEVFAKVIDATTLTLYGNQNYYIKFIPESHEPQSYEECLRAPGSRLQESYPATCITSNGKSFTQPLETPNRASCQYKGKTYVDGEGIPSGDKCNTCSCDNGQVACTTIACP